MKISSCGIVLLLTFFACSKSGYKPPAGTLPPNPDADTGTVLLSSGWEIEPPASFQRINDIFFISPFEGFLVLSGNTSIIFHTRNSGKSWTAISFNFEAEWLYLQFLDEKNGFMQASNSIGVTTDGGATWKQKVLPTSKALSFKFTSTRTGYYCDLNAGVYRTTDGGDTWSNVFPGNGSERYGYFVSFPSFLHGFLVADDDAFYRTTDGGMTWTPIDGIIPVATGSVNFANSRIFNQLQFLTDSIGFYAKVDGLFKTTDGGRNWQEIRSRIPSSNSVLHFVDSLHGYYDDLTNFMSTSDAGKNWTNIYSTHSDNIITMNFSDSSHGFVGTYRGKIIRKVR